MFHGHQELRRLRDRPNRITGRNLLPADPADKQKPPPGGYGQGVVRHGAVYRSLPSQPHSQKGKSTKSKTPDSSAKLHSPKSNSSVHCQVNLWALMLTDMYCMEFEFLLVFRHFFCHISAKSWLASFEWWREAGYPAKATTYPQVICYFLTCPSWDLNPGSGERQLAVSGNALDHTATRRQAQHALFMQQIITLHDTEANYSLSRIFFFWNSAIQSNT